MSIGTLRAPQAKNCKKWWVMAILLFIAGACSTPQNNVNTSPSALAWRNGIKGKWELIKIDRDRIPSEYTVKTLFEEAPPECFIGSIWTLPTGGHGNIRFTSSGRLCAPGAVRNIFWNIFSPVPGKGEPKFQFKKIYPGDLPKHVSVGYQLELAYADEETLRMIMDVPMANGRSGFLVFHFKRIP